MSGTRRSGSVRSSCSRPARRKASPASAPRTHVGVKAIDEAGQIDGRRGEPGRGVSFRRHWRDLARLWRSISRPPFLCRLPQEVQNTATSGREMPTRKDRIMNQFTPPPAPGEIEAFIGQVVTDLSAAFSGVLVNV